MTEYIIQDNILEDIADAIREKNNSQTTYYPSEMATAIQQIDTSGYPEPTGTVTISQNGTANVKDYAAAAVNVQPVLQAKTARHNGTVTADSGYDGLSSVAVNVPGGDVAVLTEAQWNALTLSEKRNSGLVAVQNAPDKYVTGMLYDGENTPDCIVIASGTASSSATFTVDLPEAAGYKLMVLALNGEGSTFSLDISATLNGAALTGESYYHEFEWPASADNRRNYRFNIYDLDNTGATGGDDTVNISVTNKGRYASFVYLIVQTDKSEAFKMLTKADAITAGSCEEDCIVMYGTFNSSYGGTVNIEDYVAGNTITTASPGLDYKSSYIFWLREGASA